jgi:hypothetical protein
MTYEPVSRALCAVRKGKDNTKICSGYVKTFSNRKTFLASAINYLSFFLTFMHFSLIL